MFDIKRIVLFLLLFLISYSLSSYLFSLQAVQPALHGFYKESSCSIASLVLSKAEVISQFQKQGRTVNYDRFIARIGANQEEIDRRIDEARRLGLKEISNLYCDIPFKPFEFYTVPLVFIFSLVLVTPMPIRRRVLNLILAVFAMLLFLWFKFLVQVLFSINFVYPIGMYEFGESGKSMLEFLSQAMTMGLSIMLGVVIWLILSFKYLPLSRLREAFKS